MCGIEVVLLHKDDTLCQTPRPFTLLKKFPRKRTKCCRERDQDLAKGWAHRYTQAVLARQSINQFAIFIAARSSSKIATVSYKVSAIDWTYLLL